jgi:ketosteroid isomerase-like protein
MLCAAAHATRREIRKDTVQEVCMETTTVLREDPRTTKPEQQAATHQDDVREIRAILDDYARKGSALDVEGALAHFSADIVSFDCPPPLLTHGIEPLRQSWQHDVVEMFKAPITYENEDVDIKVSGDLAVARSLMRFRGQTHDGNEMKSILRCTNVFERRDGRWLIVHAHVSVPIGYDGKGMMNLEPSEQRDFRADGEHGEQQQG